MSGIANILKRHWRLVVLVIGIVIVAWLLYVLRTAVLPFVLGLVIAYLVLPVLSWMERKLPYPGRWVKGKRVCLIILTFAVFLGLAGFLSYYIFSAVISAFVTIVENAPSFMSWGLFKLPDWFEGIRQALSPEVANQLDRLLIEVGTALGNRIREAFFGAVNNLPSAFGPIMGLGALPLFLFYVLKDSKKLGESFYSGFPSWAVEHVRNIVAIVEKVLGKYIRAQVMLGFIVAYFTYLGLLILGVGYAPVLAVLSGITELIPLIGPWIGGAVAVIVTMAVSPEKALWVVVMALSIQLLENNLLVPRIQGAYLRIHPAIAIMLLVVGGYIWGFWGVLLVLPLSATFLEIYRYLRSAVGDNRI